MRRVEFIVLMVFLLSVKVDGVSARENLPIPQKRYAFDEYYRALKEIDVGNFPQALILLNKAIQQKPGFVQFYFVKGRVFDFMNQPDSALAAYRKCLKLKSYYPQVWIYLGNIYASRKQFDQAAIYYKKAVAALPDSVSLNFKLAEAYLRLQRPALARDVLLAYRKANSQPLPAFHKWYGISLFYLKKYEAAQKQLQMFLKETGGDFESQKIFGFTEFHLGEYDPAMSSLNEALRFPQNDPEIYLYRARYFLIRNKKDVAFQQLQHGLSLDSLNTGILFEMGRLQYQGGYLLSAKNYLRKVVALNKKFWQAYRLLGLIAEKEKDWQEALKNYNLYLNNILFEDKEIQDRVAALRKNKFSP